MKYNLENMLCLDFYLSGLSNKEHRKLQKGLEIQQTKQLPLLSWDFYQNSFHLRNEEAIKRAERKHLLAMAHKFQWQNDLASALLETDYEALILTDKDQKIVWVNEGFKSMTGYSKTYALHKTPRFLQGERTSVETKLRIKSKIALNQPFKEVIVNHRKDGSPYKCEVKIFPLYNEETTHFIAFEREVG